MKKISVVLFLAVLVVFSVPDVFAKNETPGNANMDSQTGTTAAPARVTVSPVRTSPVMNQNQIKTQNIGEEQQLMIQTEEQEEAGEGTKSAAPRSGVALEHMSIVAERVDEILMTRTMKGGIGDQVRQIAQEQKQSQDQVRLQIDKLASRSGLLKSLIGPNYKALKDINKQIVQNELRIQMLIELQNQLTNAGDIAMVQETIDALIQQNTSLQEMIANESAEASLLGWLIKLFVK